ATISSRSAGTTVVVVTAAGPGVVKVVPGWTTDDVEVVELAGLEEVESDVESVDVQPTATRARTARRRVSRARMGVGSVPGMGDKWWGQRAPRVRRVRAPPS
ncbi:MAG: hypothetical protein V3W06_10855, partial [Acidimicrobiia bacterium]